MAYLFPADECLKDLENLKCVHSQKPTEFQTFLKSFGRVISEVEKYMFDNKCSIYNNKIILCLSQLKKILPMLKNVMRENGRNGFKEKLWYLCERLQWCISELNRMLRDVPEVEETNPDVAGTFVNHIDYALQLLSLQKGVPSPSQWKSITDNLLCQALTIAKISGGTDFKEISSISHKVLQESSKLMAQIQTDNRKTPSLTHMSESLAGDLITLEQRVNNAVLRLVVQEFSDSNKPLRNLIKMCGKKENSERSQATLESLIDELDTHSERIYQIGTFAIACSEDNQRINGIRCCLASLESLDNYLVPAVTAFFNDTQHPGKREFIKFLTGHWQQEISDLQILLDGIIDTSAFCQVCYEDICENVDKLKENILDGKDLDKKILSNIIGVGRKLLKHLEYNKTSINMDSQFIQDISIALNECYTVNQLYASCDSIDVKCVIKRCDLVLTKIKRIVSHFSRIINTHALDISSLVEFPDSIRDLPLDISENSNSLLDHNDVSWIRKNYLDHIKNTKMTEELSDSLQVLKPYLSCVVERNNTFYVKTPCKSKINIPAVNIDLENTAMACQEQSCLDISDILDNLTSLSDTLTSTKTTSSKSRSKLGIRSSFNYTMQDQTSFKEELTKYKILSSCLHSRMSSVSVKSGDMLDANTPERLQDLKNVEDKIKILKLGDV